MKKYDIRQGMYGLYNGVLYRVLSKSSNDPIDVIKICSNNKTDLKNGFICNDSEDVIKKYGFVCIKEVPRSEITEAYNIRTYAVYKGVNASIVGWLKDNKVELYTTCLYGEDEEEFLKKMEYAGFEFSHGEQGGYRVYAKIVSLDDPDLQLLEHRTELDIDKL